ncbi:MAG: hypothetical protein PVF95_01510 [bacterium]|jgi:hypothetical protein
MRKSADKIIRVAALAIIAAYIAPGLAFPHGVVLCVGEDGRVAVKEVPGGHCAGLLSAVHHHGSGSYEKNSCLTLPRGCSRPCLDIPVSSSSDAQQVPDEQGSSKSPTASCCVCEPIDSDVGSSPVRCSDYTGASHLARSTLRILRSVVIVI